MKYKITAGKLKGEVIELEEVKETTTIFEGRTLEWGETSPRLTWQKAKEWCEAKGDGWRMPTIKELLSVIDYEENGPATSVGGFISYYYWSSTTYQYPGYESSAWLVFFGGGSTSYDSKVGSYYVRCVRG